MNKFLYSLEVYEDNAYIMGHLSTEDLVDLIEFCKRHKFSYMTYRDDGKPGFKLVKTLA